MKHLMGITTLCLLVGVPAVRAEGTVPAFRVGNWGGHALTDGSGCEAVLFDRSRKATLSVVRMRDESRVFHILAVRSRSFTWPEDAEVPVSMAVDGRTLGSWEGFVPESGAAAAVLGDDLTEDFESGHSLRVKVEKQEFNFDLQGSRGLMRAMNACMDGERTGAGGAEGAGVTTLVCTLAFRGESSGTKTVRIDTERQLVLDEDLLGPPKFTDSEIRWRVQIGDDVHGWVLDRYAGTLTRYVQDKGENTMTRLSSGPCRVAAERKF